MGTFDQMKSMKSEKLRYHVSAIHHCVMSDADGELSMDRIAMAMNMPVDKTKKMFEKYLQNPFLGHKKRNAVISISNFQNRG